VGKSSRDKGKRGEGEVVDIFQAAGCRSAKRTAALQAAIREGVEPDADVSIGPGFHVEVKRQETYALPAWLRQLERDCPEGREGILAYRKNRTRWRAVTSLQFLDELEDELGVSIATYPPRSQVVPSSGRAESDLVELAHLMVEAGWIE
jgi:hypothetical protein